MIARVRKMHSVSLLVKFIVVDDDLVKTEETEENVEGSLESVG